MHVHTGRFCARILICLAALLLGGCPDSTTGPSVPLNFQEEELVGLWSRYHSFDGTTQYILFRSNRRACEWEETSENYDKHDYDDFTWSITGSATSHPYPVATQGRGINYTFHYPDAEVWPEGYPSLVYTRSTESRACN